MANDVESWSKRELIQEVYRLSGLINQPSIEDFLESVRIEAAHQIEHRDIEDRNKTPFDWFWTCGYLCQKAATAATHGDLDKALHHTISTAALMANWHRIIKAERDELRDEILRAKGKVKSDGNKD
jgi:hypothetical protein